MIRGSTTIGTVLAVALATAAHAQQQGGQQGGRSGMQGHDMSNTQSMAGHCADMRRQMAQGTMSSGPDMATMKAQCDQMDRQPGATGGHTPAPGGTRSR